MDTQTPGSLFVPTGEGWLPTELARGPWSPDALHGGPVAALVARAVEQLAGGQDAKRASTRPETASRADPSGPAGQAPCAGHQLDAMVTARLTVELLRPVPVAPLAVTATITRPGRKVKLVEVRVTAGERDVVWARAVLLRQHAEPEWPTREGVAADPSAMASLDTSAPGMGGAGKGTPEVGGSGKGAPEVGAPGMGGAGTPVAPPGPEHGTPGRGLSDAYPAFHNSGAELRFVDGTFDTLGPGTVWVRLRAPVVPDELPSALQRAAAAADFGNGVSAVLPFDQWRFLNPDLTVVLHRPPHGEWVGLQARTELGAPGMGVATSVLWDTRARVGSATQTLVVEHRGRVPPPDS